MKFASAPAIHDWPRVLLVAANPIGQSNSNGIMVGSLFHGWPRERLAQIYMPQAAALRPDFNACQHHWAMTPFGLRPVAARPFVTHDQDREPKAISGRNVAMRLARSGSVRRSILPLREIIYGRRSLFRRADLAAIEAFAPQVIVSTLASLCLSRQVLRLAAHFDLPIVPFITDDWITTEYEDAIAARPLRRGLTTAFEQILKRSPVRLAASDALAEEYSKRYGVPFLAFMRVVDAAQFTIERPAAEQHTGFIELVYAGQAGLGRTEELRAIADCLSELALEGIKARLTVYLVPDQVPLFGPRLSNEPHLRMAGSVGDDELPDVYRRADVLVHVESADAATARYTRFSLSTKITAYLMAGRPVFGVGPAHLGSMRHIMNSGGGIVVPNSRAAMLTALRSLLADHELRDQFGARARAFALARHDAGPQRAQFRVAITQAAFSASSRRSST